MQQFGWRTIYAVIVAVGTAVWWALILSNAQVMSWFLWPGLPRTALIAFLPSDIVFLILIPLFWTRRPNVALWNGHRFSAHMATMLTLTLCLLTHGGWLGGILMVGISCLAELAALPIPFMEGVIEAKQSTPAHNFVKALLQTSVMWGIFLLLLPFAIAHLEPFLNLPKLPYISLAILWTAFWIAGLTGIYCGLLFAIHGDGTPLPLDATTRFVVLGPYRVIRNPMATLGIFQGIIVAFMLRSPLVLAYAIAGGITWHIVARPWEEEDLVNRFGDEYVKYKSAVYNWIPRLKPYPKVTLDKSAKASTLIADCPQVD